MRNEKIRKITYAAILVAMDIVFSRFLAIAPLPYERLSLQFLPDNMAGILLGPVFGGLTTLAADLLGMLIQSGGMVIIPLISVSAALRGVIPGLLLYKKEISYSRILFATAVSLLICDIGITSTALHFSYFTSVPLWQIMAIRAGVRVVYAPIQAYVLYLVSKAMKKFEINGTV